MQLSTRQRQILSLLALGKSNKEVAYELSITEGTVKQHLSVIFKKLKVTNRTKAVIAASEFLANKNGETVEYPNNLKALRLKSDFIWRLVSSIAIHFKPEAVISPNEKAKFNQTMSDMHVYAQSLTDAFDGILTIVPGVGMIASFGAPKSHLDDATRAIVIAKQIQKWGATNIDIPFSIGLATFAEVISDKAKTIYYAESFELAAQLANEAEPTEILASELTCQLAGPIVNYSGIRSAIAKKIKYRKILISENLNSNFLNNKNSLAFISKITLNLKDKKAMWVNLESISPSSNARLQDTIKVNLQSQDVNTFSLRLPATNSSEEIVKSAYTQLNILASIDPHSNEMGKPLKAFESDTHKLFTLIKNLSMGGNLAIIFYGINSHESLLKIFGEKNLIELANYPVIIVTSSLKIESDSHLITKILGAIPDSVDNPIEYKLSLPTLPITTLGINTDLALIIDNLSENAKSIVRHLANKGSIRQIEMGQFAKEIMSTGLFILENDVISCRENKTLKTLYV